MQAHTLEHILGMCLHTKVKRIQRHDDIKDLITDKIGFSTFVKPVMNVAGDLKPDLVIKHREELMVVRIGPDADAFREKKRQYKTTADHIAERLDVPRQKFFP